MFCLSALWGTTGDVRIAPHYTEISSLTMVCLSFHVLFELKDFFGVGRMASGERGWLEGMGRCPVSYTARPEPQSHVTKPLYLV